MQNKQQIDMETPTKHPDCIHFSKGGWCGVYHDEEIILTHKGSQKRIICVRCSEILRRNKGKCKSYKDDYND